MKSKATKYLLTGIASFLLDYGLLLFFFRVINLPLATATSLAFGVGLVFNFIMNKFWVFDSRHTENSKTIIQGVSCLLLVVLNLGITNLIVVYMAEIDIGPEVSKPIATALIAIWNFAIYKKAIFK